MTCTGGLFCNRSSIGLPVPVSTPSPRALAPLAPPPRRATLVSRCGRARCLAAGPPGSRRRALGVVRGLASRDIARAPLAAFPWMRSFAPSRTTHSCPVAVGRDVPITPPTRAPLRAPPVPRCRALPLPRSITPAHYSGGAMRTSRPTAITPAKFACITQVASPRGMVSSYPLLARAPSRRRAPWMRSLAPRVLHARVPLR